jgi:hypothetical protein
VKDELTSKRRWILALLLLAFASTITWCLLSAKPAGHVDVRFLGYAFDTPSLKLEAFDYSGVSSAKRGARVARFFITNGCDHPVLCSLNARYTNESGAFFPRTVSLEAHASTNIAGMAGTPYHSSVGTSHTSRSSALPTSRALFSTEWTNAWHLHVTSGKALPLQGIDEMRYRTMFWLFRQKLPRLGRLVNPLNVQMIETDLIPPDVP